MSRNMLINAQHAGQVRIAIVDGTNLESYQVDVAESGLTRGNIYRGVVANIQPSLNAAFIDLGEEKHGFLSMDDALPASYHKTPGEAKGKPRIDQVLERKRPILVQVTKDGLGSKGPALTTNLSLAGRYLVMMPLDEVRGISRKIEDDLLRKRVKSRLSKLTVTEGTGVIVRTNGLDQNQTMLNRDLNALARLWRRIEVESRSGKGARLLYDDQDLILQALRDFLDTSIEQVIVDNDAAYERAEAFMATFMPRSKTQLIRYDERLPLFSRYHLENQVDRIYSRSVPLESGGSIVIDPTEALTAIDVNSGRATKKVDHDESIFSVNLEAAAEVGRQLRLRDIGGLVVVDFIDMRLSKHQRKVEKAMRDALKADRARHTVSRISANGLIEINRQRLKQALGHRIHRSCPTCQGVGSIPSLEFAAISLLRRIEARAAIGNLASVVVGLHPELADAMQNSHRREIVALEEEFGLTIEIIAASNLHRIEERVEWKQNRNGGANRVVSRALTAVDLASAAAAPGRPRRARKVAGAEDVGKPIDAKSDQDGGTDEAESKPKRRRRRGGRRRKSKTEGLQTDEAQAQPEEADVPGDRGDEASEAKPKRRSRRDGRGRRSSETLEARSSGDAEEPADRSRALAGLDSAAAPAVGDVQRTPVRRRLGGRSRSKVEGEAELTAQKASELKPAGGEDEAETKPLRRRGGRSRASRPAPAPPAETTEAEGAPEVGAGTGETTAPAPRQRRGGRSRRTAKPTAVPAAETSEGWDAPEVDPRASETTAPAPRQRRGGRTRGTTEQAPAPLAEASESAGLGEDEGAAAASPRRRGGRSRAARSLDVESEATAVDAGTEKVADRDFEDRGVIQPQLDLPRDVEADFVLPDSATPPAPPAAGTVIADSPSDSLAETAAETAAPWPWWRGSPPPDSSGGDDR